MPSQSKPTETFTPAERASDDKLILDGDEVEYAAVVLRDCLNGSHAFLSEIAGDEAAGMAMTALLSPFFPQDVATHGWIDAMSENEGGLLSELPMGNILSTISEYAHHGRCISRGETAEERREILVRTLERFERFLAMVPLLEWGIDLGQFQETAQMARGRWALDNGAPIEVQALALFGGVTERRIRNMMSRTENLFPNEGGRIPAREACDWLRNRASYTPSSWRDDERFVGQFGDSTLAFEEVCFVPVGPDESCFHPGLKRDGVFSIGDRGEEQLIEDFDAALQRLQVMPVPVWRRPTPYGHWTQVRGVRWDRQRMVDLEALAEDTASS